MCFSLQLTYPEPFRAVLHSPKTGQNTQAYESLFNRLSTLLSGSHFFWLASFVFYFSSHRDVWSVVKNNVKLVVLPWHTACGEGLVVMPGKKLVESR